MMVAHDPELIDEMSLMSLAAGKPPCSPFFFGREDELELLGRDFRMIAAGNGAMRFVVGDLGAGKTALLQEHLRRARRERFVTMTAEFSRDCLLHGRTGESKALLEHALLQMRTLGSGDGCAMDAVVGTLRDRCEELAFQSGRPLEDVQMDELASLQLLPRGNDFVQVIQLYMNALSASDGAILRKVRRWLLAQHENSSDARSDIGLPAIGDEDFWTIIKLWARLARLAGRPGLIVVFDELRILSEVTTGPTRAANYAQLFRIYNEFAQGEVSGLGLVLAGTPTSISSGHNSISSEPGLKSCLDDGRLVGSPTDLISGSAFQIRELNRDDIGQLLEAVREMIGRNRSGARLIPLADVEHFIDEVRDCLGGQDYPLPRVLIREFLQLHNRLAAIG
jgi:hypothetical protein